MSGDQPPEPSDEEAARRWVISVAVNSREQMSVEQLSGILNDSGFEVTGAELGSDLRALHLRVVADPGGMQVVRDEVAVAPATAPPKSSPSKPAAPTAASANQKVSGPERTRPPDEQPETRPLLLIAGGILVIAVFVGVLIALNGHSKDETLSSPTTVTDVTTTSPKATTADPANTATPASTGLQVLPVITVPGLDSGAVVRADFSGTAIGGLGPLADKGDWRVLAGEWGLKDGAATMTSPISGEAALALAPVQSPNLVANLHMPLGQSGTGIAFRVKDVNTFWMLLLSPKYGTLSLVHVEDGKTRQVGDGGLLVLPKIDVNLGIRAEGTEITGYLSGNPVLTFHDPDPSPGGGFGLAVQAGATGNAFDGFVYKQL